MSVYKIPAYTDHTLLLNTQELGQLIKFN